MDADRAAPVVVGGTGGSGTRLAARLLRELGVDLGARVNGAEDALAFVGLYDTYVNDYLESGAVDMVRFEPDLARAIGEHRGAAAAGAWGWKNPRSIFLLPLLDRLIPGLRFVHMVRHGLDMATSANRNQLLAHGRTVLGAECDTLPEEARAALLWKRVNERAADYGARMPGRYFLVRYEDLCTDASAALAPLAAALGLARPRGGWRERIEPAAPRFRALAPQARAALRTQIDDALERFGYRC